MKLPKVVEIVKAKTPRNGVICYGKVASNSRNGLNHTVVKVGRKWRCTCERNVLANLICDHVRAMRVKWSRLRAA